MRDAPPFALVRTESIYWLIFEQHLSAGCPAQTGQDFDQLSLTIPFHARYAEDFAAANIEGDPIENCLAFAIAKRKVFYGQHRALGLSVVLLHSKQDLASDHHSSQPLCGCACCRQVAYDFAVAH